MRDEIRYCLEAALALGATEAECYHSEWRSFGVAFANNRLKQLDSSQSEGMAIRLINGSREGFASSSDLRHPEQIARAAVESAQYGADAEASPCYAVPSGEMQVPDAWSPAVADLDHQQLLDMGQRGIDSLRKHDPDLLAGANASVKLGQVTIANTNGLLCSWRKSSWAYTSSAQLVEGTSILWCYSGAASLGRDIDTAEVDRRTIDKLCWARRVVSCPSGAMPVVLSPSALEAVLRAVGEGVNGLAVSMRMSPLAGRLGERVLSALVSITDDGRPGSGTSGAPTDDEGVRSSSTVVVGEGVLRAYLTDLRESRRLGVATTGNARRASGFASRPRPAHSNWIVGAGSAQLDDLFAEAKGGLLVDGLLGLNTSNLISGDFSVNASLAYLLGPDGKPAGRVKDVMIAGNVYDLLDGQLLALSAQRLAGPAGASLSPWALIKDVSVATRTSP